MKSFWKKNIMFLVIFKQKWPFWIKKFPTQKITDSKKDENPYLNIGTDTGTISIKNSDQFDYEEKFNDLPIQIKAHVSDGGKIGKMWTWAFQFLKNNFSR